MKPLLVLLFVFAISLLVTRLIQGKVNYNFSGKLSISVMLLFTAIGHFLYMKGMRMMLPISIPFKTQLIYVTGLLEVIAAVALLIPKYQYLIAWFLIIFFILILPANIYAAIYHVDYQKGTYTGSGLQYLWFRIPLQLFFIGWIYFFVIRNNLAKNFSL